MKKTIFWLGILLALLFGIAMSQEMYSGLFQDQTTQNGKSNTLFNLMTLTGYVLIVLLPLLWIQADISEKRPQLSWIPWGCACLFMNILMVPIYHMRYFSGWKQLLSVFAYGALCLLMLIMGALIGTYIVSP